MKAKTKISIANKGKRHSAESKEKMSKSKCNILFLDNRGNKFTSLKEASDYYNCGKTYVSYLLKSGKTSKKLGTGFHYQLPS